MIENDYIAKRRTATKRLNVEIRAMPEFAEAAVALDANGHVKDRDLKTI